MGDHLIEAAQSSPPAESELGGEAALERGRSEVLLGHFREAEAQLSLALEVLSSAGDRGRTAEARVLLAVARAEAGALDEAVLIIDLALGDLTGTDQARALAQKAVFLQRSGRAAPAVQIWERSAEALTAAGMDVEAAVADQNRGIALLLVGRLDEAEAAMRGALSRFERAGQEVRCVEAVHNLGCVAARRGDLPLALERFDEAQERSTRLRLVRPAMIVDRVEVTLQAGLAAEARRMAEEGVARLEVAGLHADLPEMCLLAARACETDGDPRAAEHWALRARALFSSQGRPRWELLADLASMRAGSHFTPPKPEEVSALAGRLRDAGWEEAWVEAACLSAACHAEAGRLDQALEEIAPVAWAATGLSRSRVRLVQAQLALAGQRHDSARRMVISAVRALRRYQSTVGSVELRSYGGGLAERVITAGFDLGWATGRPEATLWCAEAVRESKIPVGLAAHPGLDLLGLVASLREVTRRLSVESLPALEAGRLRRRQAALEELVRRQARHQRGGSSSLGAGPVMAREISEALEDRVLVEFSPGGDRLEAVVMQGGAARLVRCGGMEDVRRLIAGLRLALRVAVASGDPGPLAAAGAAAEEAIWAPLGLAGATRFLIVADGPLLSVPWALLPSLGTGEVVIARSASSWVRSRRFSLGPLSRRAVVVAGPGLRHAEEEAVSVSRLWDDVTILGPGEATVAAFESAVSGATLVHVAAHATHRGDNPLLSGIRLADGHVTGYELASLEMSGAIVVLSCCETGMADTGTGIGLAQLMIDAGAASVIASVSPLADQPAGALMLAVHRRLAAGLAPAAALAGARAEAGAHPSAAGLVCFGA